MSPLFDYDPFTHQFLSEDSWQLAAGDTNFYRYAGNSPTNATDPSGHIVETGWDLFSLGVGLVSFGWNTYLAATGQGSWLDVGLDAIGIVADAGAVLLPFVPGGAGVGIKALRAANFTLDAWQGLNLTQKTVKGLMLANDAANLYQAGMSGARAYESYLNGDAWGTGVNLVGAGLGGLHFGASHGEELAELTTTAAHYVGTKVRQGTNYLSRLRVSFDSSMAPMNVKFPRFRVLDSGSFEEAAALQSRSQELHNIRGAKQGTTSAMRVKNGVTGEVQTWIAIEQPQMRQPARWDGALQPGERFVSGDGHAEETIFKALGNDWYVTSGGTSVNVCLNTCKPLVEAHGLQLGGPVFRTNSPKNSDFRMFWRH